MIFYVNFHLFYIILEISKAFYLLIYFQKLLSQKSIILQPIYGYRLFETKDENNFVKGNLLLLAVDFIIVNLCN